MESAPWSKRSSHRRPGPKSGEAWRKFYTPTTDTSIEPVNVGANRGQSEQRPLLFICHSLGGLVVKRVRT